MTIMYCHVKAPLLALSILLLCAYLNGVQASPGGVRLCGKRLADKLEQVCHGRGFYFRSEKRSSDKEPEQYWKGKNDAHKIVRRTIVEECCFKYCDYEKMESYCAPGEPSNRDSFYDIRPTVAPEIPPTPPPVHVPAGRINYHQPSASRLGNRNDPYQGIPLYFFVTPNRRNPFY